MHAARPHVACTIPHLPVMPRTFPFWRIQIEFPNHDAWTFDMRGCGFGDLDYNQSGCA